jgi:hypothetical protein
LKVSVVWATPSPEKTIAIAMRRCYSTKTIEEIETELDQKGPDYWKYLLTRALQDKSLDVIEHYCLSLSIDGLSDEEAGAIGRDFPYAKFLKLSESDWLLSMNARTLIEMWRGPASRPFASQVVAELDARAISPILNALAFGGSTTAG